MKVRSIHRDGRQGAHLTQCGRREQREAQDRIRHNGSCEGVERRRVEEINDVKTTVDFSDATSTATRSLVSPRPQCVEASVTN